MSAASVEAFRTELRAWLAANVPGDLQSSAAALPEPERVRRLRAWQQHLAAARWIAIHWPVEYGGRAAGIPEQIAYTRGIIATQVLGLPRGT